MTTASPSAPGTSSPCRATDPAVRPRADLTTPDLLELLALDDAAFRERFRHSPIRRTKRRGLLRNVCVALGNLGDPRALPALHRAAETDPEPLVREHAAWAVGEDSWRRRRSDCSSLNVTAAACARRCCGSRRRGIAVVFRLFPTIHIGDRAYYALPHAHLADCDRVLYEDFQTFDLGPRDHDGYRTYGPASGIGQPA